MASLTSSDVGKRWCEALGIKGPVRKLVVEIEVRSAVKIYVQRFLQDTEEEQLLDALLKADAPQIIETDHLAVDEKGNVLP